EAEDHLADEERRYAEIGEASADECVAEEDDDQPDGERAGRRSADRQAERRECDRQAEPRPHDREQADPDAHENAGAEDQRWYDPVAGRTELAFEASHRPLPTQLAEDE